MKTKDARKVLRVGVIGLGMGRGHIAGYKEHPGAEVVAIADLDKDRLESVAKEYDIPGQYASAEEMLEAQELDIVSVATPNKFHKPLAVLALEAGCHVLCEKPMAMNASEAREMLAAAKKAGKRLMINFSYRFNEQSQALKKQVDSGVLGDVYFARTIWHRRRGVPGLKSDLDKKATTKNWFCQKPLAGGGPLIDLGVHRLDLALWLMGYPKPSWVMGSTYDHVATGLAKRQGQEYSVEDLAVGLVKFENGATLEIEASWAANIGENELMETRLMGTKGGMVQRNVGGGYDFEAEIFLEHQGAQFNMKLHPPAPAVRSAFYHFVECILGDTPHTATGEEGLVVMELLDAIYQSAHQGQPVRIGT